jgi:protein SCO1
VDRGASLFKTRCAACHTIGKGDGLGPDLANVTTRRDRRWVSRYIAGPDKMLAEGDPIALKLFAKYRSVRMPNLSLDAEEVAVLLGHLEEKSRALDASSAVISRRHGAGEVRRAQQ